MDKAEADQAAAECGDSGAEGHARPANPEGRHPAIAGNGRVRKGRRHGIISRAWGTGDGGAILSAPPAPLEASEQSDGHVGQCGRQEKGGGGDH